MKTHRCFAITVGVMVLSTGLLLMTGIADAAPPGSWDKHLRGKVRFTVLHAFNNEAVRDNNTGLVWERVPDANLRTWATARSYCLNKTVGDTVGWRLPSVVELKSVQDPLLPAPFVPTSVFTDVLTPTDRVYWSASTFADFPNDAWGVIFGNGLVVVDLKTGSGLVWCVRGPMQESVY